MNLISDRENSLDIELSKDEIAQFHCSLQG